MDEPPVELLISGFPSAMAAAARDLRRIVTDVVPMAIEVPGAFGVRRPERIALGYRVPVTPRRAPYFAWVLLERMHVHLGFEFGALLDDPAGVLEGREFRRVRYATVRSPAEVEVREADLRSLLREALLVAAWTRAERLARMLDEPGPASRRPVEDSG